MTLEQKRVLIAEACGWNDCNDVLGHWRGTNPHGMVMPLPDYFNDLTACAEMEEWINPALIDDYVETVGSIVRDHWLSKGKRVEEFTSQSVVFAHMHATAAQRAEAFGLTMGLWQ